MPFFSARPHFENRQIVQWMGESINLSGQTNFDLGGYNSYIYDSYEDFLNGVSGATFLSLPLSAATDPISGWSNQTVFSPGIIRIIPPHAVFFSGNTNVITATTQQDVTNYIATSFDSQGTIVWTPFSGITSMSGACTPNFYVGTIHPCNSGDTVIIEGNLLVRGNTISATTIIETETLLVEDNSIELNWNGNHTTAIGGGIIVLSGVSNSQDSIIATDSNGIFTFNPGISTPTIDITNLMSGETISLLAITSGGTVVEGSSMYSQICESCSGSFPSSGITIDTGTTITIISENSEPLVVDCITPKCCTQWTITYRDGRIKQELITTNYDVVLKYKEVYNAHVRCSDSNNTGVNTGGIYWTSDPEVLPLPTYDTKPTTLTGVVYEDIVPTSSTVNEIHKSYKVQLQNTSYTEINQSSFVAVSESALVKVENSINGVIDSSAMVEVLASTDGYIDGSNRIFMVASDDSTIKDANLSSIISSEGSTISGGTTGTTIMSARNVVATDSYTLYTDNIIATDNITATTFYGDGSNLTGIVQTDTFVSGGTYSSGNLYFSGNSVDTTFSVDVSALIGGSGGAYLPLSGGTMNLGASVTSFSSSATTGNFAWGNTNTSVGTDSFIGGGYQNTAFGTNSFIGGGRQNTVSGTYSSVIGGYYNTTSVNFSSIVGGQVNTASGLASSVVGGWNNTTIGTYSSVLGGGYNTVSGYSSSIVGGYQNTASGNYSSVIGGNGNTASGLRSVVIGGTLITGTTADTVYVPKLNIKTIGTGTPLFNLGLDSSGNVVTGTTGGGGTDTVSATTTTVDFTAPKIFHKYTNQATGNISEDLTGAKIGITQKIYHNDSVEPTYPAGWVLMGDGVYFTSILNIIYCEWAEGSRVEYWYVQEQ